MALTKITGKGAGNLDELGIGTSTVDSALHVEQNASGVTETSGSTLKIHNTNASGRSKISLHNNAETASGSIYYDTDSGMLALQGDTGAGVVIQTSGNNERLRVDTGGNVLVNQSSTTSPGFSNTTTGLAFSDSGRVFSSASGAASSFNRNTSDGEIVDLRKGGSVIGQLKVVSSDNLVIACTSTNHAGLEFATNEIIPRRDGAQSDDTINVGAASVRFDNIYATNGTIQTSDQNEKQNIASLTSAEMTAAKAISKLFKTFKWKDKVAAKGDAARTHTGVIAQEVQQAMTDAGLDASKYAFWCSDTWWETSTEVAAVEAVEYADAVFDDDNNLVSPVVYPVEAKDAYTRIDTYQTAEEAPEGATKRTRLGVRYPELLAFVGTATEQRLGDIETRLTALEGS